MENKRPTKPEYYRNGDRAKEFAHGMGQCLPRGYMPGDGPELLVLGFKPLLNRLLGMEGLDHPKPAQCLLKEADQIAPLRLPLEGVALEPLAYTTHDKSRHREQEHHKEG